MTLHDQEQVLWGLESVALHYKNPYTTLNMNLDKNPPTHLRQAQLEREQRGGQAALHHAHVVVPRRRLRLGAHRKRVGDHERGAGRQRHVLRGQRLPQGRHSRQGINMCNVGLMQKPGLCALSSTCSIQQQLRRGVEGRQPDLRCPACHASIGHENFKEKPWGRQETLAPQQRLIPAGLCSFISKIVHAPRGTAKGYADALCKSG